MASASSTGILKHGDDMVPTPESSDKWMLSKILQDSFFDRESRVLFLHLRGLMKMITLLSLN